MSRTFFLLSFSFLLLSSCVQAPGTVRVVSVVDGDTIKVRMEDGAIEAVRIIGINTPETVHPEKAVECFGSEASEKMKKLVKGKLVLLERNLAEDRDKYDRLLRYVMLGSQDIGELMIREGYAFSYKEFPHPRLELYNRLELEAREGKKGLWGEECEGVAKPVEYVPLSGDCVIKGNISFRTKEKIYHLPGCGSYEKTVIDESAGERWFCSEQEATDAGWRKAGNCK